MIIFAKCLSVLFLLLNTIIFTLSPQDANAQQKKRIFIVATGGTIAGLAQKPDSPTYDPAKVSIDAILASVPDIKEKADIVGEQLLDTIKLKELLDAGLSREAALKKPEVYVNMCSCNLSEYHWRLLEHRVNVALNEEGFDAAIITHGTDTIEETAFFLEMTVKSNKPVILVGAFRPSNNPQADGPDNIRQAVSVATDSLANNRGVMVILGGLIFPAFNVTEDRAALATEPLSVRFSSRFFGPLGSVSNGRVEWNESNRLNKNNTRSLKFYTTLSEPLPEVPILTQYVGSNTVSLYNMYKQRGVDAFVVASFGLGSMPNDLRQIIQETLSPDSQTVFVNASRTKEGFVDDKFSDEGAYAKGFVFSGTLTPVAAKIFLQLVLMGIKNGNEEIRAILEKTNPNATLREKVRIIFSEVLYRRLGHLDEGTPKNID